MNGIMSGIQDRKNYANGPENPRVDPGRLKELVEEYKPVIEESISPYEKPTGFQDPLYQLGISLGLDLMSKADSQSLLRNIGAAGARQTPKLFQSLAEERAAKRKYDQGVESAAVGLAGDILGKELTAAGRTREQRDPLLDVAIEKYVKQGLEVNVAEAAANFERYNSTELRNKVGSSRYGGVVDFDLSKPSEVEANKKLLKQFDGQVVFDPFSRNYKRIEFIDGQPYFDEFESIDAIVFPVKTETEEPKKDRSRPMFGLDMDDPQA
jgi:hypothetical protein